MHKLILPEPLHALLNGIEASAITNFYGAAGTGKTNICLLAALDCMRNGGQCIYIDTEGGFSGERLAQLGGEGFLEKITLVEPKTFAEQSNLINELKNKKTDLIVLDSAVALYRLEYAEPVDATNAKKLKEQRDRQIMDANRELSRQLSILSTIAREKDIPVIITAHTFKNWETGAQEIVGGEVIKYWSKAIVYLERTGKMSERKATIFKHRFMEEGKSVKLMIVKEGIKPSGFRIF